jgi:Ca-activated chloride channel family protein
VALSGTVNDRAQQFATEADLTDRGRHHAFIPRLWATRRVGYLLDEIRLHGESRELKDEVTQLAREYGIVTPYTAYLIMEDERARRVPLALQNFRELQADAEVRDRSRYYYESNVAGSAHAEKAGEQAVTNAQAMDSLRRAGQIASVPAASATPALSKSGRGGRGGGPVADSAVTQLGYKAATNYAQQSRVVNGRAFYQNGTTWTDSTAQARSDLKQQQIQFNSDEYFALLSKHPDAAAWLALGNEVDVVIGDTLYQIR